MLYFIEFCFKLRKLLNFHFHILQMMVIKIQVISIFLFKIGADLFSFCW